ncbi:MAG: 50S ribosomal protein L6 [Elusimicrobia bacterium]|nr:50S ribosomal protein L6 [Candidatus Liberimonas magnetica]
MSRLGKKPLTIPEKVKVEFNNNLLKIKGPLGEITQNVPSCIKTRVENNEVFFELLETTRENDMLHGLTRGMLKNNLIGVVTGFKKDLEMSGLGYKAAVEGKNLNLQLGFSHPISFPIPQGITIAVDKMTHMSISGINKDLVGEVAAHIRSYRPPEPYKGTGIKYVGEHIIRKVGKAAATATGGTGGK